MSMLNKDFADTRIGWVLLRVMLPLLLIVWGGSAVWLKSISFRHTDVVGASAVAFGLGILAVGVAIFGMPSREQIYRATFSGVFRIRFILLGVAVLCLVVGAVISYL